MKDDITNTSLRGVVVLLVLFSIWVVLSNSKKTFETQKKHEIEIKKLNRKIDSLGSEIFILNTIVMRYEIATEILEEESPKAAEEFNNALSKTE